MHILRRVPHLFMALCLPGAAAQTWTTSLAAPTGWRDFGRAQCALGDLDGDGVGDLALAGIESASGEGRVRLLSGANLALLGVLGAGAGEGSFGAAVVGGGDLDGDGLTDVVVGAPAAAGSRGRIAVFSGLSGRVVFTLTGSGAGEELGAALAIADLDGDGHDELLVGAPMRPRVLAAATGKVLRIDLQHPAASWVADGPAGSRIGRTILAAGDWNRDGVDDLAVGSPEYHGIGGPRSGRVFLLSGLDGAMLAFWDGRHPEERFGTSLALGPDLGGDGLAELFVGAPYHAVNGRTRGRIEALDLRTAAAPWSLVGWSDDHLLGSGLEVIDDIDGDGLADLLVGSPVGMSVSGRDAASILSARSGCPVAFLEGRGERTDFGEVLSASADLDGDGRGEFLIGDRNYPDRSMPGTGRVHLYRCDPLDLLSATSVVQTSQGATVSFQVQRGPGVAGGWYLLLGSAAGREPGLSLGSAGRLPLNSDPYTDALIALVGHPAYGGLLGGLDPQGGASFTLDVPAGLAAFKGLTLHHAALVYDSSYALHGSTRAVALTLR